MFILQVYFFLFSYGWVAGGGQCGFKDIKDFIYVQHSKKHTYFYGITR